MHSPSGRTQFDINLDTHIIQHLFYSLLYSVMCKFDKFVDDQIIKNKIIFFVIEVKAKRE